VITEGNTMAAPAGESTQCSMYVVTGSTHPACTVITVARDDNEILGYTPDKQYQNLLIGTVASSSRQP
jgi:hypothetical protein